MKQVIEQISNDFQIRQEQVMQIIELLKNGNTIPFIARYRKNLTGNLDEEKLFEIDKQIKKIKHLEERKGEIIRLIEEKNLLTSELVNQINSTKSLKDLELLYEPFKSQKITNATKAIGLGIEPLAKEIFKNNYNTSLQELITKHKNSLKTQNYEEIENGVMDILMYYINTNPKINAICLETYFKYGSFKTKQKVNLPKNADNYEIYYDFKCPIKFLKSYQIMAINRAEKEKVISVSIELNEENLKKNLVNYKIKKQYQTTPLLEKAILNSYTKLIKPKVTREIRKELTIKAHEEAIKVFGKNTQKILMQRPLKNCQILGIDPGFTSGCKIAIIDENGKLLKVDLINLNNSKDALLKISQLIEQFKIDLIAIGNGTAGRQTEQLIAKIANKDQIKYAIVDERGASVYSASKIAREEFGNLNVEERSAISIARRLQDPLSELVKIEPRSIGVGQYQHDLNPKELSEELDFAVQKIVNNVGVNLNTASFSILSKISGLTNTVAKNIVKHREENGPFETREQLKKVKGLGPKAFEQAAGFLKIPNGKNILDQTIIHPESYQQLMPILSELKITTLPCEIDYQLFKSYNLENSDFLYHALTTPINDPREQLDLPILRAEIMEITDLKNGEKVQGVVNNITQFGAFVDIGVKQNGLIHISKLPTTIELGQVIEVIVEKIDIEKKRIFLEIV